MYIENIIFKKYLKIYTKIIICIKLESSDDNIILRNNFTDVFNSGVYLKESNDNRMENNTVNSARYFGFNIQRSSGNKVEYNTVDEGGRATYLYDSDTNSILKNVFNDNSDGVYIERSSNNTVEENMFFSSTVGVNIYGYSLGNKIISNIIKDANDVSTGIYAQGYVTPRGDYGYATMTSDFPSYNIFINNTISNFTTGILLNGKGHNIVKDNLLTDNEVGLKAASTKTSITNIVLIKDLSFSSANNDISNNRICSNTVDIVCESGQSFYDNTCLGNCSGERCSFGC